MSLWLGLLIAREVETGIGRALLTGEIHDGATITVELDEHGQLSIRHQNPPDEDTG